MISSSSSEARFESAREAGTYTNSIKIRYSEYERAVKPLVADLALDYSEDWSTWS